MVDLPPLVHVTQVQVVGEHELRLAFEDSDWTGVFEPLRDPRRFAQVCVEGRMIVWPDYGLDMAPEPLYAQARRNQSFRAMSA
jgi:Protein of unknown function (DUF2442)